MTRYPLRFLILPGPWIVTWYLLAIVPAVVVAAAVRVHGAPLLLYPLKYLFIALGVWALILPLGESRLGSTLGTAGHLDISAEGLVIQRKLRRRFVPRDEIVSARAQGVDRVRVWLTNGSMLVLGCEDSEAVEASMVESWCVPTTLGGTDE